MENGNNASIERHCPTRPDLEDKLVDYLFFPHEVSDDDRQNIEQHLGECEFCQGDVSFLIGLVEIAREECRKKLMKLVERHHLN